MGNNMVQAVRQDTGSARGKTAGKTADKSAQRGELRLVPGDAHSARRAGLARAFRGAGGRTASVDTGIYG